VNKTNLLLLLTGILLCCTGCEEKKTDEKPLFVENTTEVFTQKDKQIQEEKQQMSMQKSVSKDTASKQADPSGNTYILQSVANDTRKLALGNQNISFGHVKEPVILLTLLSSFSHPYLMQTASFEKLQKKFKDSLFIASISSKPIDDENTKKLKKANYFISSNKNNEKIISAVYSGLNIDDNTSPLTIIYKNNAYYSHFEGPIPIEMLKYEIQQAIQN